MRANVVAERLAKRQVWLVTGAAGFIGSHLVEELLRHGQCVIGLDNLSTGSQHNLEQVRDLVKTEFDSDFRFIQADITDLVACREACRGVDHVLHQAALGSVPRSLADPIASNAANVTGFLNVLVAARDAGVHSLTYAASSSTYGDEPNLPKIESRIGSPLSPYAVTKLINELYADVFARSYGFTAVGLRYFNVFGPRQDANGAYAAVIPRWVATMIAGETVTINGDGETSRDFCFVENAVQANILASTAPASAGNQVYNVAVGAGTTLNELFIKIREGLIPLGVRYELGPIHAPERAGDVRHSLADIGKARRLLSYAPSHSIDAGLSQSLPWYVQHFSGGTSM